MTPKEFRFQLRTIFFPIKSKNYDSGTKLNPGEEILLLDICNIVRIGEQNSEVDYQNAFDNNIYLPNMFSEICLRMGKSQYLIHWI